MKRLCTGRRKPATFSTLIVWNLSSLTNRICEAIRLALQIGLTLVGQTLSPYIHASVAAGVLEYGVSFFDEEIANLYSQPNAMLGKPSGGTFFIPIDDAALLKSPVEIARATGMAPRVLNAYLNKQPIYGISFPIDGLDVRLATAADANGFPHWLDGGNTAVQTAGPNGGYLVNPTREFVFDG